MKQINAVIIEDESLTADKLQLLLQRLDYNVNVLTVLESVSESIAWLGKNQVDLIFMDIHLSDGKAFEIFQQLEIKTPIIFVTAYDKYALEAFKEYGIDYILKPISIKELNKAMDKYSTLSPSTNTHTELDKFFNALEDKGQSRFLVNMSNTIKAIETESISYFYAENKMTFLVDENNQHYPLDQTLEKLEKLTPKHFFRTNRKTIVNIKRIKQIQNHTYSRLKILMEPEASFEIIVPLERVGDFKNCLIND